MHPTHLPRYVEWTPATNTTELPSAQRGRPYWETQTVELHLLDLRPTVTRVDRRPPLLVLWLRVLASPAADHLRASARSAFWPAVVCAGLVLGVWLLWVTRGSYVTWSGFQPIPGGAR